MNSSHQASSISIPDLCDILRALRAFAVKLSLSRGQLSFTAKDAKAAKKAAKAWDKKKCQLLS